MLPILLLGSSLHTKKAMLENSKSVVKVLVSGNKPNFETPWEKGEDNSGSGSGVVIKGNLILTAAHVVTYADYILVKKYGSAKKYKVRVKWIAHDADLALLEVEDVSFFKGMKQKRIGGIPSLQDDIAVYGYPVGGEKISITQGVISRLEMREYAHSRKKLLMLQVDAAINSGNSGGPAFNKDGEIVGIALQAIEDAKNSGYITPASVINHFLEDIKDGDYDGFPVSSFFAQELENPSLKAYYKMENISGVMINGIYNHTEASKRLIVEDIILNVDGHDIADDGSAYIEGLGRLNYQYLFSMHYTGDVIKLHILRDTKEIDIQMVLKDVATPLTSNYNELPRYYIKGGLYFFPATLNTLKGVQSSEVDYSFFETLLNNEVVNREAVILGQVFDVQETIGLYADNNLVLTVNGESVTDFNDFIKKIEKAKRFVKIVTYFNDVYIIDKICSDSIDQRVKHRYKIEKLKAI